MELFGAVFCRRQINAFSYESCTEAVPVHVNATYTVCQRVVSSLLQLCAVYGQVVLDTLETLALFYSL